MIIAIDGPAGSGKTTVAKLLAQKLNVSYLDTGATYRALTLKSLEKGMDLSKALELRKLAQKLNLEIRERSIYLDGCDVSQDIRAPRIDKNISAVVCHPQVREIMVDLQRKIAKHGDYVVEGRDITTVVFPQAEFKFYLDANASVRAKRRFDELKAKGLDVNFQEIKEDLEKRDYADKNRKVGPLRVSEDATFIDTSYLSIEQVIEELAKRIKI